MSCITLKGILLLDPNSGDLTSSTHTKTALTSCMLGNFSCFRSRLLIFFFKINFFTNSFRNTFRVSNGLDPDQNLHSDSPDPSQHCLQRLSTDDKRRR